MDALPRIIRVNDRRYVLVQVVVITRDVYGRPVGCRIVHDGAQLTQEDTDVVLHLYLPERHTEPRGGG